MIIFCYGCSFTGGVYEGSELKESWPYRLSLMLPNSKVYNFGKQATSVLYSLNMIEQSTKHLKPDLILTQLTEPTRITFYDHDYSLNLDRDTIQLSNNYYSLKESINDKIYPVNAFSGKKQSKEIMEDSFRLERFKTYEKLVSMLDDINHFDPEYRAFYHRAVQLSNFVFFHRKLYREVPLLENVPCVEKELGTDNFLKFVVDKGFHFGKPGSEWIANWLYQKLHLNTTD
jgi:hypothetical protein